MLRLAPAGFGAGPLSRKRLANRSGLVLAGKNTAAGVMANKPIGSWRPSPKQGRAYEKEAARLRRLAPNATTNLARTILEDQAQAQERLAAGRPR
jgi:hypothetical protein